MRMKANNHRDFILECAGRAQRRRRFSGGEITPGFFAVPKRCRASLATAVQNAAALAMLRVTVFVEFVRQKQA